MTLLDDFDSPSGLERNTRRPVWRARDEHGRVYWAYLERRPNQLVIIGYAQHDVELVRGAHADGTAAVLGAGVGALIGSAMAGWTGVIVGGFLGLLFGSSADGSRG